MSLSGKLRFNGKSDIRRRSKGHKSHFVAGKLISFKNIRGGKKMSVVGEKIFMASL